MKTPRSRHTSTLLPNGKVLVTGGRTAEGVGLTGAEVYDPSTNSWQVVSPMRTSRSSHTATLLPDGKVLVTSSCDTSVELYDPTRNLWLNVGPLAIGRAHSAATLLPNSKVLLSGGGACRAFFYPADSELYDLNTQTWSTAGPLIANRGLHTATSLLDGKVLVAGGQSSWGTLASAEFYDPATDSWTNTGTLKSARIQHTATRLPNGEVLVTGGWGDDFPRVIDTVEQYGPALKTWKESAPLATARTGHTATLLPNGQVLVVGGENDATGFTYTSLASTELFVNSPTGATARVAQFASRATLTPTKPVFGAFVLTDPAKLLLSVRGPSMGTLGVSATPHPHPSLSLYNGAGQILATSNACTGATPENAAVVAFYRDTRDQPLSTDDACLGFVTTALPAGIYTFMIVNAPSAQSSSGEVLFEVVPVQYETSPTGATTRVAQFATRATLTPTKPVFGAFVLTDPAKLLLSVRGPSMGTLDVSESPHPHPSLSLYNGAGQFLATSNECAGATPENAAVVDFYRDTRDQPVSMNDACLGFVTTTLPAGIYTFLIVNDPSARSSSGEVLFEVVPVQ
jgi:hypothetical protein